MSKHERKPNRLISQVSTYLRQHAYDPVDWYPWGWEAFKKAKAENKPIFLSIGYATCHWCHVMAKESFADEEVARLLNEHFVSIKVDRQELPRVDEAYMRAAIALTGQGGWPLSVFCTPEGFPFFAGTYFPPQPRGGLPSFRQVLETVARLWREKREELLALGQDLLPLYGETTATPQELPLQELEREALAALEREFDPEFGGFGTAPKFPQPAKLEFLLEQAALGNRRAQDMLAKTLDAMATGGIFDALFGGFHRYSTDRTWFVPHYEKMLPDNALLARLYMDAACRWRRPHWRKVALGTLGFLMEMLQVEESDFAWAPFEGAVFPFYTFAAGRDADTNGEEGKTYTFTLEELRQLLSPEELQLVTTLSRFPWVEGEPRPLCLPPFRPGQAALLQISPETLIEHRQSLEKKLRQAAEGKGLPAVDQLHVSGWVAMAVVACVRICSLLAGTSFRWPIRPKSKKDADAAAVLQALGNLAGMPNYAADPSGFLVALDCLWHFGFLQTRQIPRVLHQGSPQAPETLEDLAWTAAACLDAGLATGATTWLWRAFELLEQAVLRYSGEQGELYGAPLLWPMPQPWSFPFPHTQAPALPFALHKPRPPGSWRVSYDNAHPSPGAVLCQTLYRAWLLSGNDRFRECADRAIACEVDAIRRSPHNACSWLQAARLGSFGSTLVVAGNPSWPSTKKLVAAALRHRQRPAVVLYLDHWPPTEEELERLPILRDRPPAADGRAAAYLCYRQSCWPPVTEPKELDRLLRQTASTPPVDP